MLICPANSPEPNNFSLATINDKEKEQILVFKKLEPANVSDFCLEMT